MNKILITNNSKSQFPFPLAVASAEEGPVQMKSDASVITKEDFK